MTAHDDAMNCRDMAEHLSGYLDAELDEALRRTIERHEGRCPPCRAFIRTLARTVEAVRSMPRRPLPPALKKALREALLNTGTPDAQ